MHCVASPSVGEGEDGEKPGISALLMFTPTPPSPAEGEEIEPRLTAPLVLNRITPPPQGGRTWCGRQTYI
jgi:hypothetical protein